MRECWISIWAVVDINNDGFVSEAEYVEIFKSWGHKGAAHVKQAFRDLGPVYQSGVAVCDVAHYWYDFTAEDNPAKTHDEVEIGFESNVDA